MYEVAPETGVQEMVTWLAPPVAVTPDELGDAWRDGKCDGVVTYCLDKRPQSQTFPLAQKLFHDFGDGKK